MQGIAMSYNKALCQYKESENGAQLIETGRMAVSVDTHGHCTVSFGQGQDTDYSSMQLNTADVNNLIRALEGAVREQNILRLEKQDMLFICGFTVKECNLRDRSLERAVWPKLIPDMIYDLVQLTRQ